MVVRRRSIANRYDRGNLVGLLSYLNRSIGDVGG